MGKLALNKSTLNHEQQRLKSFRQFVPALDLKRKQILAARLKARQAQQELQQRVDDIDAAVQEQLPMLAGTTLALGDLVKFKGVQRRTENLVGIELPIIDAVDIDRSEYSRLALPQWVDVLVHHLAQVMELRLQLQNGHTRLERLEAGLQKTTQRLNLFDKVLIPQAERNIRRIRIALSDAERAGVVRAKIAKNKRARMSMS